MQNSNDRRRAFCLLPFVFCFLNFEFCLLNCDVLLASGQTSDLLGLRIIRVHIEQEGREIDDQLIRGLIETMPGEALAMSDVRQTIDHVYGLGRYEDVQVLAARTEAGVVVTYVLVPLHAVQRLEFRGTLGVGEEQLRQAVGERFGALPAAARANDVARFLEQFYRGRGHIGARVVPRIEEQHAPDRATMIFDIEAGPRATIERVDVEGTDPAGRGQVLQATGIRPGRPYDIDQIQQQLERYERGLRSTGYYEARVTHTAEFTRPGGAAVNIAVDRGPLVVIAFSGDPLPEDVRDDLVPVEREGSVDEDLLEDASRAIGDYLYSRGYREANAPYTREERDGRLVITFNVSRGPRHIVDAVEVNGGSGMSADEVRALLEVKEGEPFVQAMLDAGVAAIRGAYRTRGFTRADVTPLVSNLPADRGASPAADRRVRVAVSIAEGARTSVGSVTVEGNTVLTEEQVRALMTTAPGRPYWVIEVAQDRDRVQLEYLNRGYESAVVDPHVTLLDDNTRADVRFAISEGPQILIDHVIIIGNQRTSTGTIERELTLRPGEPLGYAAVIESRQRLAALGLFRRVQIEELRHGSEPRRDILVQVEEAPPTTIGYGAGLEAGSRPRPTGVGGTAEERFEVAPRGFVEVGRRNLFGKNRSINLFTRVSLRARDVVFSDEGIRLEEPDPTVSGYGFNEYRVVTTYREPRVFNTRADMLVTGILDQAIRSSFNFITREARVETGVRLTDRYNLAGRYSYKHTKLFDERFSEDDKPLIDRLFPEIRLSKFSGTALRDTRTDALDPDGGRFVAAENDLAMRAIGSEVGFVKTFLQAFSYHRLPVRRRTVLALAARFGAAQGFPRKVPRVDASGAPLPGPDGQPIVDVVEDLPASERFFAGGDTTVRGFSLDRLGTEETTSATGFVTGGNGLVVLNTEMRVTVWGGVEGVGFFDVGNVFARVRDIDLGRLRPAAGMGVRYRSPVGPIRVDLGFNLNRREVVPGRLERLTVLHISLGQAF
jgi:outer membrane protein insertion porin family